MKAGSAIVENADWRGALSEAERELSEFGPNGTTVDLAVFFASPAYATEFDELLLSIQRRYRPRRLIGCSGQGVIGVSREMEGVPALSLMLLSLPGAELTPARFTQREVEALETAPEWRAEAGLSDERVNGWLLFADPFRIDSEALIGGLASAYPRKPIVGGLASGDHRAQRTHVFLDDQVFSEGAVGLAVGGAIAVKTVVSQGCAPIGEAWTITGVQGNVVETISGRSALEVLIETLRGLPPAQQRRAERNLLVGLAIDEYRDTFTRGDFLIRNLTGVDQESGAIGLNAYPRLGQTIQFQMRDAAAADDDINELLGVTTSELGNQKPVAAVLCSCNGRGAGLFGAPDHDAAAVAAQLGRLPVAGFFCNGEIGPIGDRIFLHGFTASIALLVPA